jgi:hypothetical protein
MSDSPAVILYDYNGNQVCRSDGYDLAPVVRQSGLIVAGITDAGKVKFFSVGANGALNVVTTTSTRNIVGEYLQGTGLITGSTSIQNLVTLENPVGSGRTIYSNKMEVNGVVSGASSTLFSYRIRRTTGLPTGGTILTPQKRRGIDLNAVGIVRQLPIVTADSGTMWATTPGLGIPDGKSWSNTFEVMDTELERHEIVLSPGEALLFSADENGTNWRHWINIVWAEEPI